MIIANLQQRLTINAFTSLFSLLDKIKNYATLFYSDNCDCRLDSFAEAHNTGDYVFLGPDVCVCKGRKLNFSV